MTKSCVYCGEEESEHPVIVVNTYFDPPREQCYGVYAKEDDA